MTPKHINHIEIIEEIGSGGTSSVLKWVDQQTDLRWKELYDRSL
jgi:hypothetical protein